MALKHDKQLTKHSHNVKHLRYMPDYLKSSAGVGAKTADKGGHKRSVKRKLRPDDDPLKVCNDSGGAARCQQVWPQLFLNF